MAAEREDRGVDEDGTAGVQMIYACTEFNASVLYGERRFFDSLLETRMEATLMP